MMKECPYTDERRDALENTPPSALEISLRRGFCTPRPERLPEGEARGQSRGPRGAKSPPEGNLEGRGGCIFRYIPTRGSVRTFFHHYQGSIDFLLWQQMALLSVKFCLKKNLLICNHSRELLLLGDPFLPLNRPYLYSICRYWIKIQLHSLSKSGKIEFCPFCTRAQPSWVDELLHRLVLRRGARDRGTIS